jgi:cytochrome c oxidase cbb3-type subunit III
MFLVFKILLLKKETEVTSAPDCKSTWNIGSLQARDLRKAASALVLFLSAVAFAVAQQPASKPNPMLDEDVQRGAKQFLQSCSFCHGPNATGATEGPNLILSATVRHDKNGELIGPVIREGRPGKGMPAFPLTAAQIADIVAFLHARIVVTDNRSAGGPKGGYTLKQLLTGDAVTGKAFFFGAGQCSTCHSPTGDLKGVAKKYEPVDLQAKFLYPDSSDRKPTAVVLLSTGKQVKGELVHHDRFYVGITDADGWYRSWPANTVKVEVNNPLAAHEKLLKQYTNANMHDLFAYLETLNK